MSRVARISSLASFGVLVMVVLVMVLVIVHRKVSGGVPIRMQLFSFVAKTVFTLTGIRSSNPSRWTAVFGIVDGRRALTAATAPFSQVPVGTWGGVSSEDIDIDVGGNASIKVRVYVPDDVGPGVANRLPIVIFYHGGGHTIGSYDDKADDVKCRDFALKGRWLVVSPEYRLAPENPFPTAVHDAYAVAKWAADASHFALRLGDRSKLVLGGDSAGGNLAAVVSLLAAKDVDSNGTASAPLKIRHQLLAYPAMLVPDPLPASRLATASAYVLPKYATEFFQAAYLGQDVARRQRLMSEDPRVNPGLATVDQLGRMPDTTFIFAEHDPALDEGRNFAALLRRGGAVVSELFYAGMPHGFLCPLPFLRVPSTIKAIEDAVSAVNEALGQPRIQSRGGGERSDL